MGTRKLLTILFFLVFITACYGNEKIFISNCVLTEDSIVIEVDIENVIIHRITGASIIYKNIAASIWFDPDEITYNKTDSKIMIELNLKNEILHTNDEAELFISISGGGITGDIFIGNPISKIEPSYSFPSNAYEKVRIIIFDQFYTYRK